MRSDKEPGLNFKPYLDRLSKPQIRKRILKAFPELENEVKASSLNYVLFFQDRLGIDTLEYTFKDKEAIKLLLSTKRTIPWFLYEFIDFFIDGIFPLDLLSAEIAFLDNTNTKKLYDPFMSPESFGLFKYYSLSGVFFDKGLQAMLRKVPGNGSIYSCITKEGFEELTIRDKIFDFVVSFPTVEFEKKAIQKACQTQKINGVSLIKCSPNILLSKFFEKENIGLKAVFKIPSVDFDEVKTEDSLLVIPEKGYRGKAFTAELTINNVLNKGIYEDYLAS